MIHMIIGFKDIEQLLQSSVNREPIWHRQCYQHFVNGTNMIDCYRTNHQSVYSGYTILFCSTLLTQDMLGWVFEVFQKGWT